MYSKQSKSFLCKLMNIEAQIYNAIELRSRAVDFLFLGLFLQIIKQMLFTPTSVGMQCPKGHYKKARGDQAFYFAGVSAPYEAPKTPNWSLMLSSRYGRLPGYFADIFGEYI